ncbi:MAG TPA: BatA domain-containing protein [Candidatus Binatia bacterium]|nr:BatA domain-containing protein [Candidatus Binatia bacterium]
MSLFFLHPLYLYGLLAASLPLLIHLLNRRKLKRIRFPAVRFVLLSQRRISRSYRLRHWLLLALRTLAVVFLALLLANPIFQTGVGLFAAGGPVSLVIVLDNSLSMTWSADGNGFKQAKDAARLLIASLNDNDRAAVIPTNISGKEQFRLKAEKGVLLKEIDGIQISDGTANIGAALTQAYALLNEPAAQKEIRLISDTALTGWDQFSISSLKQYDPLIPFKILQTGVKDAPLNGTIREIRISAQGVGVDLPLRVEAVITNFGEKEIKDLLAQLSIDGQSREQKLTTIPPKGETVVNFNARLTQPGSHVGQVTLKKEGLAGNPTSHFALEAQDKLRILVVDGDPQTSLAQSETFFLTRALNPAGERDSSLYLPTVIIPEGLNSASLDSYQAVILCNVASIPDAFVPKLQNYLRQGGGLLIFGGDRVQMENYNLKLFQSSPPILPAAIREKKLGPESAGEKIGKIDRSHPILQSFSDSILQASINSTRVWGYNRTDGSGKSPLVSLANGDPLLVEQKVGSGRVLFLTTTADRDWSDLPLKTAYLPLIQSITSYLAGEKRGLIDTGIAVGSTKQFLLAPTAVGKNLKVTKPNKRELEVLIVADKDRAAASIQENDLAGIYRLSLPGSGDKQVKVPTVYAVNPPFLESRLERISHSELQAKLKPIAVEVIPIEALEKGGKRMDLSLPLLALLIVTLFFESWIAQRI